MRRLAVMLSVSIAMGIGAAQAQTTDKALVGTWTATAAEQNGAAAPELVGHRLLLDGDAYAIVSPDGKLLYSGTYKIDARARPAAIDFTGRSARGEDANWEGIYRLAGNSLMIVDDAPDPSGGRPTAFAAPAGSGQVMLEFERSR